MSVCSLDSILILCASNIYHSSIFTFYQWYVSYKYNIFFCSSLHSPCRCMHDMQYCDGIFILHKSSNDLESDFPYFRPGTKILKQRSMQASKIEEIFVKFTVDDFFMFHCLQTGMWRLSMLRYIRMLYFWWCFCLILENIVYLIHIDSFIICSVNYRTKCDIYPIIHTLVSNKCMFSFTIFLGLSGIRNKLLFLWRHPGRYETRIILCIFAEV